MTKTYRASRTAVMVGQGRAAADGLIAPGRFADPTAWALRRDDEREAVRLVREGTRPRAWRERVDYETVRAMAAMMAPRTIAIDDAIREHPTPQLVILGAGLDGRAWRMKELAETAAFEVDQPASQSDKRDRAARLSGAGPVFVPVDFGTDRLDTALAAAGHRAAKATTWVCEGVVPYLTGSEVATMVAEVAAGSAPGSRLIVNFQAPARSATYGRIVARMLMASTGRSTVWAKEPWRSTWTPAAMAALLARHGFTVGRDESLLDIAVALGLPVEHRVSHSHSRVAVADRA